MGIDGRVPIEITIINRSKSAANFQQRAISQRSTVKKPARRSDVIDEYEEHIAHALEDLAPDGPKRFPADFLSDLDTTGGFFQVKLPGTPLGLAPYSKTLVISPKWHFRYQAKNPAEAKYIIYAHDTGTESVSLPNSNLTLFKAVKAYERYCDEVRRKAFELFLGFTYDEQTAEHLTLELARRLALKAPLGNI